MGREFDISWKLICAKILDIYVGLLGLDVEFPGGTGLSGLNNQSMDLGIAMCLDPDRTGYSIRRKRKLGSFTVVGNIRTNPLVVPLVANCFIFCLGKKEIKARIEIKKWAGKMQATLRSQDSISVIVVLASS